MLCVAALCDVTNIHAPPVPERQILLSSQSRAATTIQGACGLLRFSQASCQLSADFEDLQALFDSSIKRMMGKLRSLGGEAVCAEPLVFRSIDLKRPCNAIMISFESLAATTTRLRLKRRLELWLLQGREHLLHLRLNPSSSLWQHSSAIMSSESFEQPTSHCSEYPCGHSLAYTTAHTFTSSGKTASVQSVISSKRLSTSSGVNGVFSQSVMSKNAPWVRIHLTCPNHLHARWIAVKSCSNTEVGLPVGEHLRRTLVAIRAGNGSNGGN